MLAATSWAARLKAGLARTREVLTADLGSLLVRRPIDESLFEQLETALLSADCGVDATRALLDDLRGRVKKQGIEDGAALKAALKAALLERLAPLERRLALGRNGSAPRPYVIMIAGVNGSGKTTSIGKLAKWLQAQGASVLLAAGDTFRAAAREQLAAWGERNGVPVIGQQGGDAGAVVFDAIGAARARGIDVLIADTAGRLPTQLHLMEEIKKVKRVIAKAMPGAPHEIAARARRRHRAECDRPGERVRRGARPDRAAAHQAGRQREGRRGPRHCQGEAGPAAVRRRRRGHRRPASVRRGRFRGGAG